MPAFGAIHIDLGEALPLWLQLFDGASNKFCHAIVRDNDGAPVPGSPFLLTNIGGGEYRSNAFIPTGLGYYSAQYVVFDDPGRTQESMNHSRAYDVFSVAIPAQALALPLAQVSIENPFTEANVSSPELTGHLVDEPLHEEVE